MIACGALLLGFAVLAHEAARQKSPTYDEPLHAVGAWLHLHHHDFRINPEDPPLWHYWAALPNGPGALEPDFQSPRYASVAQEIYFEWRYVVETLYPCGRSLPIDSKLCPDADAFVMRSRRMMLALGVLLGGLLAWWGWRLGGGVAAVAVTTLFALDPNFLGHAALVKNDVALTLVTAALAFAVWRAGLRLTPWNALAICLLCTAAVTVKFSGLLLGPIVGLMLIGRAAAGGPWPTFRRTLSTWPERLGAAAVLIAIAGIVGYAGIWAAYGFRFGPSPDPSVRLGVQKMAVYAAMAELTAQLGHPPSDAEVDLWEPGLMTRSILYLNETEALPQAWLYGLLYTYQSALARDTFLMGEYSKTGWWYYFPFAMLVKTPLTTLVAGAGAIGILVVAVRKSGWRPIATWTTACLIIPPAIYLGSAMRSNLNLGLRHILPVYPFVFLGIALAAAYAWRAWRQVARYATLVLALGLTVETLVAFPDFIAFFNAAAGGSRGGIRLLGDSNLDWGQDLKSLAEWQQRNTRTPLYLVYFGVADPWSYGIRYRNLFHAYGFGPKEEGPMNEPGVVAVSATYLQGIYLSDEVRSQIARLHRTRPLEVLGGTIYLYPWPPPPASR